MVVVLVVLVMLVMLVMLVRTGVRGVTRDRETGRHTQTHRQRARALGVCEKKGEK